MGNQQIKIIFSDVQYILIGGRINHETVVKYLFKMKR